MIIHKSFGLDLGTTNSTASIVKNNKIIFATEENSNNKTIPSIFALRENKYEVCGTIAKQQFFIGNPNSKKSIKRDMGKDIKINFNSLNFTPEEISAKIIDYCKQCLLNSIPYEENVVYDSVVITVPAYFNLAQKDATRKAGEIAGLKVQMLIEEPTAAAINYAVQNDVENGLFFVFDLGGGTFDVSILEKIGNIPSVLATAGNNYLGGDNFDMILARYLLEYLKKQYKNIENIDVNVDNKKFRLLLFAAEEIKKQLSNNETYNIYYPNIFHDNSGIDLIIKDFSQKEFNELIKEKVEVDIINECDKALGILKEKYNKDLNDITHILMVGGSTKIPYVKEFIKQKYCITENLKNVTVFEPDLSVSSGAALVANSNGYIISDVENKINIEMNSPFLVDDLVYISGKLLSGSINKIGISVDNQLFTENINDDGMFVINIPSSNYSDNLEFKFYHDDVCLSNSKSVDDSVIDIIAPTPVQNEDIAIEIINIEKGTNEKDIIIPKGYALPCDVQNVYKTNEYSSNEVVLPVWEGPRHIFNLVIDELSKDVEIGSKIYVKTYVDSISNITLEVLINGIKYPGRYEKVKSSSIDEETIDNYDETFNKRLNYIDDEDQKEEYINQSNDLKREMEEAKSNNDNNHYNAVSEKYEKMLSSMPSSPIITEEEFDKIGDYIKDNLNSDLNITSYDVDNLVFYGKRFLKKNNIEEAQKCMDELLSYKRSIDLFNSPRRIYDLAKYSALRILFLVREYITSSSISSSLVEQLKEEINMKFEDIQELLDKYDDEDDDYECDEMKDDAMELLNLTSTMYSIIQQINPSETEEISSFKGLVSKA